MSIIKAYLVTMLLSYIANKQTLSPNYCFTMTFA